MSKLSNCKSYRTDSELNIFPLFYDLQLLLIHFKLGVTDSELHGVTFSATKNSFLYVYTLSVVSGVFCYI